MNEYERLIDYLNSVINNIESKKQSLEYKNGQLISAKISLENFIELISERRIDEINVNNFGMLLSKFISEGEVNEIKSKLNDLLVVKSFLYDDRIFNPIKQMMLMDLETIKFKLNSISNGIKSLSLSEEDLKLLNDCKRYLSFVDKNGYTKVLTDEDRCNFCSFLKSTGLEDAMLLIADYLIFVNKTRGQREINTSNTAIEIVNKNAEKVIEELEKKVEKSVKKTEIPKTTIIPTGRVQNIDFSGVHEKILELLDMYQDDINPQNYEVYSNYFSKLDIYEIYNKRGSFSTIEGVNWEMAIPCIKERLLPNINSDEQSLIFKIFNEIINLNQSQLERYEQEKQRQEKYKNKLEAFKKKFVIVLDEYNELSARLVNIIGKINDGTKGSKSDIDSLLDIVKNSSAADDGVKDYLDYYGISYDELVLYGLYVNIQENINHIKEYIELVISEDDFGGIDQMLSGTEEIIKECVQRYEKLNQDEFVVESFSSFQPSNNKKQYETGESIIVFFRRNEGSKFLIEEDIDRELLDEASYSDISKILKRTNDTSCDVWGKAMTDSTNFKSFIRYAKPNGKMGDIVTVESNYSHEKYPFFRLKDGGKTVPRLSAFDIHMCDENREKLGITKDKHIILIIGEKQVTKHSNENTDYSDVRRELKNNIDLIQKYIELFENPNSNEEVLYKILNDSSDLYSNLMEKGKGLVE